MGKRRLDNGDSATLAWLRSQLFSKSDDCIEWPFSKRIKGYGNLGYQGKVVDAHRLMCELAHGLPPDRHVAAHSCHNPGCVNPRHLSWKTTSENLLQMRAAGSLTKKRWNKKGTLSTDEIAEIRKLKDYLSQYKIAAMFGISYQHVGVLQRRKMLYESALNA